MAKPFDATTRQLVEMRPLDWLRYLQLPGKSVEIVDAELSTVTTEADRVLKVSSPVPYLVHIEFSSVPDDIEERTLRYNILLWYAHKLPVVSVIILLRPSAERRGRKLTGILDIAGPEPGIPEIMVHFRYHVVRVWELSAESLLNAGLAMLPFAPLGNVSRTDLPLIVDRMQARIQAEASPLEARELWSSVYLLLGLRYKSVFINDLLKGMSQMRDSSTYQAILAEGKTEGKLEGKLEGELSEARRMLVLVGRNRLGVPSLQAKARIDAIVSLERLEQLAEQLLAVESWDDLLIAS